VLIRTVDRKEFEERTFPHAYDVLVYQEGGHYYAKDAYGNVICVDSGTGCLQEGINHGKNIYVKGIFNLDNPINITSGKVIHINGYISSVRIGDYAAYIEIIGKGSERYNIGNLYIEGGAAMLTFRNLHIDNTTITHAGDILFDSCRLKYVNLQGYGHGQGPYWITFLKSWISNSDGNGIDMAYAVHILFISSMIVYNNGIGLNMNTSRNIKFINSIIEGNKAGIAMVNSDVVLEGTLFYANNDYGIYMGNSSKVIIKDYSHVRALPGSISILIDSTDSLLMIDRLSIIDNIIGLDKLAYFKSDNPSYLSKNTGQATIPANATSITVNHGLICTPKKVLVTPLAQPPGSIWVSNITGTSFNINVSAAPTTDLPVAWYAEC